MFKIRPKNLKISKKTKRLITIILIIVLLAGLVGGGYFGLRSWSYNNLINYLSDINTKKYQIDEFFADTNNESSKFTDNITKIYEADSEDEALSIIDDSDRILNQQIDTYRKYCDNTKLLETSDSEYVKGNNLILVDQTDKDSLNSLFNAIDQMQVESGAQCQYIDGLKSASTFLIETAKATMYMSMAVASNYEDTDAINKLSKYSDGSYKLDNKDQMKGGFGQKFVEYAEATHDTYRLFYEQFKAYENGDIDTSLEKYDEYVTVSSKLASLASSYQDEYKSIAKENSKKGLDANKKVFQEASLINNKLKIANYVPASWSSDVLIYAIEQYQLYNNDKYPDCADSKCLINELNNKRYLDGTEINSDWFKFISDGDDAYELSFKNEISNRTIEYKQ